VLAVHTLLTYLTAAPPPPSPTWFPKVSPAAGGGAAAVAASFRYTAIAHEDADGFDEYEIVCKLGKGSFATVYEVAKRPGVAATGAAVSDSDVGSGSPALAAKSYKKDAMARIRVSRARSASLSAPPPMTPLSLPSMPRSTPSPVASPGLGGGLGTMLDMLHDEIALLRRLRHPNCVATYDVRESASRIWVVMDRLDAPLLKTATVADAAGAGESVRFACPYTRRPLSEARARAVALQMCAALDYLHREMRVYHRDIKPDNVMWQRYSTPAGEDGGSAPASVADALSVVLVDFGLAAPAPPDEVPCITVDAGTPAFAAPETLVGAPYDPFAADMWAAGVTLYACLAGRLPFTASQGLAAARAATSTPTGDGSGAAAGHSAPDADGLFTMSSAAALNRAIAAARYEWPTPLTDGDWDAAALRRRLAGGRDVEIGVDGELTAADGAPGSAEVGDGVPPSPQLTDFLAHLLHADPAARLTAAAALAHPWLAT